MRFVSGMLMALIMGQQIAYGDIESGPSVGAEVSALNVFAVTGDMAGKDVDLAKERGNKPTIYVFVPHERFDRPIARFLKELEKSVKDIGGEAQIVTVFLTDDPDKTKAYLPKAQMSLQFTANPLVVFPSAKMSPNGWAVNSDAHVTAVVVQSGKVAATFGYRSVNETVVPEIVKALKKAVEK